MTQKLYPIKFDPIPQYRIWGGNHLNKILAPEDQIQNLGEIWCLSNVEGSVSIVKNGQLKGENLNDLIANYKQELLGKHNFEKYGLNFPLLIKFIDAQQPLSVQVHPNDELAIKRHQSFGKSEMWYILQAQEDAELIIGFEGEMDKKLFSEHLQNQTLDNILHREKITKSDAVYLPAGRVHAIGEGIILAEIQQTSDITYRIFDYDRIDKDGKKRALHTDLAMDAIDFSTIDTLKTDYDQTKNQFNKLIDSPYFETEIYDGNQSVRYPNDGEFKIIICTEGQAEIITESGSEQISKYEIILIPASVSEFEFKPQKNCTIIVVNSK